MAFDIKKYYDDNRDYYGDSPLEDVAKDAYSRFGVAEKFPSYDDWKTQVHIQPLIEEDSKQREIEAFRQSNPSSLGALGRTLTRVPENLVAKGIQAVQGKEGASITDRGIADQFVNFVEKRNRELAEQYEGTGDVPLTGGLISKKDVAEFGPNLAYMGVTMPGTIAGGMAGAAAGGATGSVPGAAIGGVVGGMAGGGLVAHRATGYQVMTDWLEKKNEEIKKLTGKSISPEEEKKFKEDFGRLADKSGLWEAGPEAAGNVLELALMKSPMGRILSMVPKGVKGKIAAGALRAAGLLGTEAGTETVTQMGQQQVESESGMSDEKARDWKNPDDWMKSLREVLPSVLLLTGGMSAGGAAYRKLASGGMAPKKQPTTASTDEIPETRPPADQPPGTERENPYQSGVDELDAKKADAFAKWEQATKDGLDVRPFYEAYQETEAEKQYRRFHSDWNLGNFKDNTGDDKRPPGGGGGGMPATEVLGATTPGEVAREAALPETPPVPIQTDTQTQIQDEEAAIAESEALATDRQAAIDDSIYQGEIPMNEIIPVDEQIADQRLQDQMTQAEAMPNRGGNRTLALGGMAPPRTVTETYSDAIEEAKKTGDVKAVLDTIGIIRSDIDQKINAIQETPINDEQNAQTESPAITQEAQAETAQVEPQNAQDAGYAITGEGADAGGDVYAEAGDEVAVVEPELPTQEAELPTQAPNITEEAPNVMAEPESEVVNNEGEKTEAETLPVGAAGEQGEYLYHAVKQGDLDSIRATGLAPPTSTMSGRVVGDINVSFSEDDGQKWANALGQTGDKRALIRFKNDGKSKPGTYEGKTGKYYQPVKPENLEAFVDGEWTRLAPPETAMPKNWFELGRDISFGVKSVFKPKKEELASVAKRFGITQTDARRALDFYNYSDTALIEGKPFPKISTAQPEAPQATPAPEAIPPQAVAPEKPVVSKAAAGGMAPKKTRKAKTATTGGMAPVAAEKAEAVPGKPAPKKTKSIETALSEVDYLLTVSELKEATGMDKAEFDKEFLRLVKDRKIQPDEHAHLAQADPDNVVMGTVDGEQVGYVGAALVKDVASGIEVAGDDIPFSTSEAQGNPKGLPVADVQKHLSPIIENAGAKVTIFDGYDDPKVIEFSKALTQHEETKNRIVRGFRYKDRVYVNAAAMDSLDTAERVLAHELAHYGLDEFMGPEADRFFDMLSTNTKYRPAVLETARRRGINTDTRKGMRKASSEFFAESIENNTVEPTLWTRFLKLFRDAMRRLGFSIEFGDAELAEVVRGAYQAAMRRETGGPVIGGMATDMQYSFAGEKARTADAGTKKDFTIYNPQKLSDSFYNNKMGKKGGFRVNSETDSAWAMFDINGKLITAGEGSSSPGDRMVEWEMAVKKAMLSPLNQLPNNIFIRFGDIPKGSISKNWSSGAKEKGISVYGVKKDLNTDTVWFDGRGEVGAALMSLAQGRKIYLVSGDVVGRGTDGEPVIKNAKMISQLDFHPDEKVDGFILKNQPAKYTDPTLTQTDKTYLKAVESGDMAAAEKIVAEAAADAGYYTERTLYHGTPNKNFTVFEKNRGIFKDSKNAFVFTDKENVADEFLGGVWVQEAGEVKKTYPKDSGVFKAYLDLNNVAIWEWYGGSYNENDVTAAIKKAKRAKKKGVIFLNMRDGSYTTAGQWPVSNVVFVFDPNQIKSADPITRDDTGQIIAPSKRFNPETDDIRFSVTDFIKGLSASNAKLKAGKLKDAVKQMKDDVLNIAENAAKDKKIHEYGKEDISWFALHFSTPLYHKVKQLQDGMEAKLKWVDDKYAFLRQMLYENEIAMNTVMTDYRKAHKEKFEVIRKEILDVDRDPSLGYKMREEVDKDNDLRREFIVEPPTRSKRKEQRFNSESDAVEAAIRMEAEDLAKRNPGFTSADAEILKIYRGITNRMHEARVKELKKTIAERRAKNLEPLEIAWREDDGTKEGKKIKLSLETAIKRMGDLRFTYMPRIRKQGWIEFKAEHPDGRNHLEFFDMATLNPEGSKWKYALNYGTSLGFAQREYEKMGYVVKISKADKLPESVFLEAAGKQLALNDILEKALEKTAEALPSNLKGLGIEYEFVTNNLTNDQDLILRDYSSLSGYHEVVLRELGGRYEYKTVSGKYGKPQWVFEKADKALLQKITEGIFDIEAINPNLDLIYAEAMLQSVADVLKSRGSMGAGIQRVQDYWEGFETDPIMAVTRGAQSLAGGLAKRKLAEKLIAIRTGTVETWEMFQDRVGKGAKFSDYRNQVKEQRLDPSEQPNAMKEFDSSMREALRNEEPMDRVVGTLNGLAVLKFLAFRISGPLANLTALPTTAVGSLVGRGNVSITDAMKHIGRAAKLSAQWYYGNTEFGKKRLGNKNPFNGNTPEAQQLRRVFEHISSKGWDVAQRNYEALSAIQTKFGQAYGGLIDWGMAMFGLSERINRMATIAGSFFAMERLKINEGKSFEEIMEKANAISNQSHGVYSKANKQYLTRGGDLGGNVASALYLFQNFGHNYILNLHDIGISTPQQRKAVAYLLVSPMVIGGLGAGLAYNISLPMLNAVLAMFGADSDDPEEDIYRWFGETFGNYSENLARFGAAGALGINLKGSIGMGNNLELPTKISDLFGAPGSMITDTFEGAKELSKGNYWKGFEKFVPNNALSNISAAVRQSTEGVTKRSNAPVFYGNEPLKFSTTEAVLKAFSFNPAEYSSKRERMRSDQVIIKEYNDRKTEIRDKYRRFWLRPIAERSTDELRDILADVVQLNTRIRTKGLERPVGLLTPKSLRQSIKRANTPSKLEKYRAAMLTTKGDDND